MVIRVLKWLLFSGGMSLLPLMLTSITLSNHGKLSAWSITWERGEFLLISATLLIAALGEMVAAPHNGLIKTKLSVTAIVLTLAIGLCAWYGSIVECIIMIQPYAKDAVIHYSPRVYGFSLLASMACVMLSFSPYNENYY